MARLEPHTGVAIYPMTAEDTIHSLRQFTSHEDPLPLRHKQCHEGCEESTPYKSCTCGGAHNTHPGWLPDACACRCACRGHAEQGPLGILC